MTRFGFYPILGWALLLTAVASAAQPPTQELWSEIDSKLFRLESAETDYRLVPADGSDRQPLPVPTEWLEPPHEVEENEAEYVTRFAYDERVDAFPAGGGRIALHLGSYAIQTEGSAQAAMGRDTFLFYDPDKHEVRPGLDLGPTRWRVRVGGCFAAVHHRIWVADINGDGLTDIATVEQRIECDIGAPDETLEKAEERLLFLPAFRVGPLAWYVQEKTGWQRREVFDGRLPAGFSGLRELPLIGASMSPVDYVLSWTFRAPVLRKK